MVEPQVKHGMLCPLCKTDLMMTDRQGVEVDYCPKCRGVWLDRGELDKIIERSAGMDAPQAPQHPQGQPYPPAQPYPQAPPQPYAGGPYDPRYEGRRYRDDDDDYKRRQYDPRYRKKKSWLGDILDFD
jgi:Zn-finger nucleic acid-binding protein